MQRPVFLATDSKEVEEEFLNEFWDKVIVSGKENLNRNSVKGIKNALIDMICLSRTKKNYGSYGSSFSYMPIYLSDTEFECVTDTISKMNVK